MLFTRNSCSQTEVILSKANEKAKWPRLRSGHDLFAKAIPAASQASTDYFRDGHFDIVDKAFQLARDYMTKCLEKLEPVVSPNHSVLDTSVLHNVICLCRDSFRRVMA